ncbi:MAG TPA: ribosome small subunit-dependent GTPase A, partial [Thermomicrobiales bacterium]|nr:ribosome small subunit-dependent GTPase A [Thermomicrobiales bacterium]
PPGTVAGRVTTEKRGGYGVAAESGDLAATVSGRLRHEAQTVEDFPAVGDWVALEIAEGSQSGVIQTVLPRLTRFLRPQRGDIAQAQVVAANVDTVLLVTGLDHDFNLRRLERYLALAWSSGADPVVVLNKADLAEDLGERMADVAAIAPGVPVRAVSAREGTGFDGLSPLLEAGKTVALIGSSGVGKSTIVNHLLGFERQATGAVRDDDQRGRHTTTSRELVTTPSGVVLLDSPGMRSVGMWEIDEGLADAFADIEALAQNCRFSDCSHGTEPGCAVQAAIRDGTLPSQRLESQQKLARESAAMAMRVDPQMRAAERAKWKAIHKSVRNHMKIKYGAES